MFEGFDVCQIDFTASAPRKCSKGASSLFEVFCLCQMLFSPSVSNIKLVQKEVLFKGFCLVVKSLYCCQVSQKQTFICVLRNLNVGQRLLFSAKCLKKIVPKRTFFARGLSASVKGFSLVPSASKIQNCVKRKPFLEES